MNIQSWLSGEILAMGGLGVVTLLVLVRIFRSGLGTYTEARRNFQDRIRKTEEETREYNLAMPLQEQMAFMFAAVRELLDLAGNPAGFRVEQTGTELRLETPGGEITVRYAVQSRRLHSRNKVLHGASRWELLGPGEEKRHVFLELDAVVRHLQCLVAQSLIQIYEPTSQAEIEY
ncbi:MAG: hypothetical protein K2O70_00605, partial [Desulfovibrionaceae bacterium]|nr:hypothetical protein [Desulfovibrionaceae bacterium]